MGGISSAHFITSSNVSVHRVADEGNTRVRLVHCSADSPQSKGVVERHAQGFTDKLR